MSDLNTTNNMEERKMDNKTKGIIIGGIILVLVIAIIAVASSGNSSEGTGDNIDGTVTGETITENVGDNDGTQITNIVQMVDKSDIGITMELSGDFGDCTVTDLTQAELDTIIAGAEGGFKITKDINSEQYTLSTVVVAHKDLATDPQVRGAFPYIYEANEYSVLANINNINDGKVDTTLADRLNAGVINQLTSIFFDETVFTGDNNVHFEEITAEAENNITDNSNTDIVEDNTDSSTED